MEDQLADTEERLAALKRGAGRITRRTDIEATEAAAERQRGDLTAWQERLEQLTARPKAGEATAEATGLQRTIGPRRAG